MGSGSGKAGRIATLCRDVRRKVHGDVGDGDCFTQVRASNLNSSSQSGPNQGSDGGSTPHNESFQPPV